MPIYSGDNQTYVCTECKKKIEIIYCSKCDVFYDAGHDTKCFLRPNPPHMQTHK